MMTPQIKLNGWWWKRFFPKYRAIRTVMQRMVDDYYPEMQKEIERETRDIIMYGYPKSRYNREGRDY